MTQEPDVRILKAASCPSLTDRSTLSYEIGANLSGIHLRIVGNTGAGHFSSVWISLPEILELLESCTKPFTWEAFYPLFKGMSVNTAGFLVAALKNEGLVRSSEDKPRRYENTDPKAFMAQMDELLQSADMPKPKKKGAAPKKTPAVTKSNPPPQPEIP